MTTADVNASGDHSRHVEQVFDQHYSRLQHYFIVQLGSISEADACVRETIYRFFDFMKGRQWEQETDYINVYLMRIAAILCSEKLAEKKSRGADSFDVRKNRKLFQ